MASLNERSGPLGKRLAAHLLRRSTYRISKERVDEVAGMTAAQAVNQLFNIPNLVQNEPLDPDTNQVWLSTNDHDGSTDNQRRHYVRGWWLNEALHDPSIGHRLAFFLHTNFSIHYSSNNSFRLYDYLQLLRFYAKGSLKTLAKKMTTDSLMLAYLNNTQNNKANPNENYAREFLELFTIGKGEQLGPGNYTNYTEYDIQQAARVLTGFKTHNISARLDHIDPDTNIPRGRAVYNQHDTGNKTFSSAFGGQSIAGALNANDMWRELNDFVNMVFDQVATARHICRKLYRFFVHRDITNEIENDIIIPLANTFKNSDYNIETTVKQLLKSRHFFDADDNNPNDEVIGGLVRGPLELALQSLTFLDLNPPDAIENPVNHHKAFYRNWLNFAFFPSAGFELFAPSDVSGYSAYYQEPDYDKIWFTSSSIIARYKLPEMMIQGKRILYNGSIGGVKLDMVSWVDNHISNGEDAELIVSELVEYMLPEVSDATRKAYFLTVFLDDLSPINWKFEWQAYKNSGDSSSVRIPLEKLITTILYAQEYQLF